jgi:flagellar hook-associated protein 2
MAGISLGGMASGLDTQSLIDQLVAADRAPEKRLKLQQSALQARQSALSDIGGRLRSLMLTAKDLGSVTTWASSQTVDVSSPTTVSATKLSGAAPGGHTVEVTNLARAEQRAFTFTPGTSTLDIDAARIDVTADDTGATVADKINAAVDSPVYAVWVKDAAGPDDGRLYLTRKQTGALPTAGAGSLSVTGAALTQDGATIAGVDATYSIDGRPPEHSATNVLTTAIPGLQLTLKAAGTTSVTVGAPSASDDAVKSKVQAFVDQYNSTIDFIQGKLTEKRVPNAASDTDARKGVLFGDTQLSSILSQLRQLVSDKTGVSGSVQSFGDIGVSTGAASTGALNTDSVAGKLSLNGDKLVAVLQSGRTDVKTFLGDPTSGMSAKLTGLLTPIARVSDGTLDVLAKQAGDDSKEIDDRIAVIEDRVTQTSDRLRAQFTAMEQALSQSQTQSAWLAQQLR